MMKRQLWYQNKRENKLGWPGLKCIKSGSKRKVVKCIFIRINFKRFFSARRTFREKYMMLNCVLFSIERFYNHQESYLRGTWNMQGHERAI